MARAPAGVRRPLPLRREAVRGTGGGGFTVEPVPWDALAKRRRPDEAWTAEHADLAASVQRRLEEVLLDLVRWLHASTGDDVLTMAGGVALNCVANSRVAVEGPFRRVGEHAASALARTPLSRD